MLEQPWYYENDAHERGFRLVCGTDEAGRGPLAGDIYAGAVILPPDFDVTGLDDSKKLSEKKRDALYTRITEEAVAWAVAAATFEEIDRLNILNAAMLAMRRAIESLPIRADYALVDGDKLRDMPVPARCIVNGDALSASIAAASVLAKVSRDRYMVQMAERYPGYGFEKHKGYPTKAHYDALREYGPCPIHRRTFLKKLYEPDIPDTRPGQYGEDLAVKYLTEQGYEILERNYRIRGGELDIIAKDGDVVVFVEVKERRDALYKTGMDAVTPAKIRALRRTGESWFQDRNVQARGRFDVLEVYVGTPQDSPFGPTYPIPKFRHTKRVIE
ncbi:MAG: ribonuclease HII [Eubacteriales bacterium]|jgi:ribonuclease HII